MSPAEWLKLLPPLPSKKVSFKDVPDLVAPKGRVNQVDVSIWEELFELTVKTDDFGDRYYVAQDISDFRKLTYLFLVKKVTPKKLLAMFTSPSTASEKLEAIEGKRSEPIESGQLRCAIADNLSNLMHNRNLSQRDVVALSKDLGDEYRLSQRTVGNTINASAEKAPNPQLDTLIKFAKVFNLEAWQLLQPGFIKRAPSFDWEQYTTELPSFLDEWAMTLRAEWSKKS